MRTSATFQWIGRHLGRILITITVLTVAAVPFAAMRLDAEEPSFDPTGELYDIRDLSDRIFVSDDSAIAVPFVVEARGGVALSRDVLLEWKTNSDRLRNDPDLAAGLATQFAFDWDVEIRGVYSVADAVDDALPGGLAAATDAEVKAALVDVLGEGAVGPPIRSTLAQSAAATTRQVGGQELAVWESPAFMARLLVDHANFPDGLETDFSDLNEDAQEFARDAQAILKGDEATFTAWGVGFDGSLTFNEQLAQASPFILFAIVGAEYVLRLLPRGTHEYAKLIRPSELAGWSRDAGLDVRDTTGMTYNPVTQVYKLNRDVSVNYLMHAVKGE